MKSVVGSKVQFEGYFRILSLLAVLVMSMFAIDAKAAGFYRQMQTPAQRVEKMAADRFQSETKVVAHRRLGEFCGAQNAEYYEIEVQIKEMVRTVDASGKDVMVPAFKTVKTYAIPSSGLYAPNETGVITSEECANLEK